VNVNDKVQTPNKVQIVFDKVQQSSSSYLQGAPWPNCNLVCLIHVQHTLTAALLDAPQITIDQQLTAIVNPKDLFNQWCHQAPISRVKPMTQPTRPLPAHAPPQDPIDGTST
jgi:hypothetical protein